MGISHVVYVALKARDNHLVSQMGDYTAALEGTTPASIPPLAQVLDDLANKGVSSVYLVGVFLGAGTAPQSWLRRVAGQWVRNNPGHIQVFSRKTLLKDVATVSNVGDYQWRQILGSEAPLNSPTWEDAPAFRHHVLLCAGIRCLAKGADDVGESIATVLKEYDATDTDVLVTRTLCQFPCNQGPLVVVYPDNEWHCQVTPEQGKEIALKLLGM